MSIVNFSLGQIRLVKSVFLLNPVFRTQSSGVMAMQLRLAINHNGTFNAAGDAVAFIQNFKTADDGEQTPFSFEVEFEAFFHLSFPVPPQEHEHIFHQVLPPIVFPFTREYLAELTRRSGFPPLLLNPTFDHANPEAPPTAPFKLN